MPTIEQYSLSARPIEMLFQGTFLSLGTGFVWKVGSTPGMSGSPVIRHVWNTVPIEGGGIEMILGNATRLVGVYSGRLATGEENDVQLGMVWPAPLIDEILLGGRVKEPNR